MFYILTALIKEGVEETWQVERFATSHLPRVGETIRLRGPKLEGEEEETVFIVTVTKVTHVLSRCRGLPLECGPDQIEIYAEYVRRVTAPAP